jgi:hypothetical protein
MAANLAAYKAKLAAKIEARKAKATSSVEVDELTGLLSRVSMSSSVDDLEDLMKDLKMGGRRRTRKQKHRGKKRGGNDPTDTRLARCREEVRELEAAVDRLRRQSRGGRTRKTRRGGVQPPANNDYLNREHHEDRAAKLRAEYEAVRDNPNSTAAEIETARKESIKADRMVSMMRRMMAIEGRI